jgi:hypothetical protein
MTPGAVWETTWTALEAYTAGILDGFPQNTVRNANQSLPHIVSLVRL